MYSCGCEMKRIKEIVSEQYDIIPAKFQVIENVRFIYACSNQCGQKVKTYSSSTSKNTSNSIFPSYYSSREV